MNQLVGPEVQIVLSLKEVRGFNVLTNPICIRATLNGLSLESDYFTPDLFPDYATNLIWEANKNVVRRMRSNQNPLKVECFEVRENGIKDKIGYLLMSLRGAQIVPNNYTNNIKTKWYNLFGVRSEMKRDKPEFSLSLIISEKTIASDNIDDLSSRSVTLVNEEPIATENISTPYLIEEEHLIQLGPVSTCGDIFLFSIMTETIYNLDTIKISQKSPTKINIKNKNDYTLWYYIFDSEIQSKQIPMNVDIFPLNEKIVIRIRSSLKELKLYLQSKPYFIVILKSAESVLGESDIDLRPFLNNTRSIEDFLKNSESGSRIIHEQCTLNNLEYNHGNVNTDIKPYINIKLMLQYVGQGSMNYQHGDSELSIPECETNCHRQPARNCSHSCIPSVQTMPDTCPKSANHLSEQLIQHYNAENSNDICNKAIMDELIAWKKHQKELFELELKQKEERHLQRLSDEWQKRREYLETKIVCNIEQYKSSANTLNSATDDLRTRKLHSLENEARLIKVNDELKRSYEKKLQELKDASHKLQQDFTLKLTVLEEQKKVLEVQLESMNSENKQLQEVIRKQSEQLDDLQKADNAITQDNHKSINLMQKEINVLEKKLENTRMSKRFFKEQWGKAIREIHKMQMGQATESQLKTNKDELQNVNLEKILYADSAALNNDKILLGQIQREIDVIKPRPSFMSRPPVDLPHLSIYDSKSLIDCNKPQFSAGSEEQEGRLRTLIEERDALLKTGSYGIDDAIVVKLNTEIRSLLMSS